MSRPALYVSVDIETDGPFPPRYSLIQLGAVDVDNPDRRFKVDLQPISDEFVPEALAVSGLDRERLKREGVPAEIAMRRFSTWVTSIADGRKPVFCSFSSWDWLVTGWYLQTFTGSWGPFSHSSLDMKSWYGGFAASSWGETGKGSIKKTHPELLAGAGPHTHDALDDAVEQAVLLKRMLAVGRPGRTVPR